MDNAIVKFASIALMALIFPPGILAEDAASCYSGGSIAAAVLITLFAIVFLQALAFFLWKMYWSGKSGQHLVLISDPEKGESVFAFDNPGFKEGSPIVPAEKEPSNKLKWPHFTLSNVFKPEVKAMDDSYTAHPPLTIVPLRSHDFTGLGFNICGNMRDGIYIKDVLHRGPASESGCITPGDRIESIKVSFRNMVFEDALTILSYASPYEVELSVESRGQSTSSILRTPPPPHKICHPFYRSHSSSDLQQIGKLSKKLGEQPSSLMSDMSSSDLGKPTTLDRKNRSIEQEKTQNSRNSMIESKTDSVFHEIDLEVESEKPKEHSPNNMKFYLVKGIQNLKEKLHNSLHMEEMPKEEVKEVKDASKELKEVKVVSEKKPMSEGFVSVGLVVPDVVEKAAAAAKENRKSTLEVEMHDEVDNKISVETEDPVAAKRSKRKAPKPPQDDDERSLHSESDSEAGDTCGTIELNSTHITVHQAPTDNENRKASSLGDLSRYEADSVILLERAVSLDLGDGAPCKKRKAPIPPQDDCLSPHKEARLDNGIAGTLKKSSVWGTLEEIIQNGSESETDLGISGCSTPEKGDLAPTTFKFENSDGDIQLTLDQLNGDETPPDLPTSPVPTLSSFITEIQVTSEKAPDDDVVHFDSTEQFLDHMASLKKQEMSPILNNIKQEIADYNHVSNEDGSPKAKTFQKKINKIETKDEEVQEKQVNGAKNNDSFFDKNETPTKPKKAPAKPPKQISNSDSGFFIDQLVSDEMKEVASNSTDKNDFSAEKLYDQIANSHESPEKKSSPATSSRKEILKTNMSDEQILAMKASPPQTTTRLSRPNNVTVTTIKQTTPSRIPVRAKSPGTSLSPTSDKRSMRNGHGSP